jgi:hypothetical protein
MKSRGPKLAGSDPKLPGVSWPNRVVSVQILENSDVGIHVGIEISRRETIK